MANTTVTAYLKQNPKMMGGLFTILLLLTQAGNTAAANCGVTGGP